MNLSVVWDAWSHALSALVTDAGQTVGPTSVYLRMSAVDETPYYFQHTSAPNPFCLLACLLACLLLLACYCLLATAFACLLMLACVCPRPLAPEWALPTTCTHTA